MLIGIVLGDPFGSPNAGISFKPIGGIQHSGEHYFILYDVDITGLIAAIEPIKDGIENIKKNLQTNLNGLNGLKPLRSKKVLEVEPPVRAEDRKKNQSLIRNVESKFNYITTALTDNLQEHITYITQDIWDRQRELEDHLLALGQHISHNSESTKLLRARRALCDGCGRLVSWIFGLTTNSELKNTTEALERLSTLSNDMRQMINLHTTILNSSSIHIKSIDKQVTHITELLSAVNGEVSLLGKHVQYTDQIEFTIVNSITLLSSLTHASEALGELRNKFINFKMGIDQMRKGYLNTDLVPPETLLSIIQDIINQNLKSLWPATSSYIAQMYRYITVRSLPHDNLSFVIQIPLEGIPSIRLNLYKVIQIPHPLNSNLTLNYADLPKYFSISDDHSYYVETNDLGACRTFEDLYVCPINEPIYTTEINSCALALFRGTTRDDVCQKQFGPALTRPLVQRTAMGWMYSTSFNIKLTLICHDSTTIVNLAIGSGVLNLPDKCRAVTKYFLIPANVNTHGRDLVKNISLVNPFKLKLTPLEWEDIALINNSQIGQQLIDMNNDRLPLKGLKEKVEQLKYVKSQRQIHRVTSNSGLTLGIICLILIIVLFIVIYLFIRTARNNENDMDNEDNDDNDNTNPSIREQIISEFINRKRRVRYLKRTRGREEQGEATPLEDDDMTRPTSTQDRRFHSSPNSPAPVPRERSNTEASTVSMPRVSIMIPDSSRYDVRPDSQ